MQNDRSIHIRLPAMMVANIEAQAQVEGRSLSDMMRRIIVLGLSTTYASRKPKAAKS